MRDVGVIPLVLGYRGPNGVRVGSTFPVLVGRGLSLQAGDTVRVLARATAFRAGSDARLRSTVQWRFATRAGRTVVTSRVLPTMEQVERLRVWLSEEGITLVLARASMTSD